MLIIFDVLYFLFIASQEMNDTSHLAQINMMTRYEDKTLLVASIIAHTIINLSVIGSAYMIRGFLLYSGETQVITLSCFFFMCGYELLVHTMGQLLSFFDLWTGPMTGMGEGKNATIAKLSEMAIDSALSAL